ncbi:MAG TPA: four helix bundle protein [Patescibacteria group bacterium]
MKLESYRDLIVWQRGVELTTEIYKLTSGFPKSELYGITSQLRRAAVSIPANLAEGYYRNSKKDYQRFCYISFGSGSELETLIIIAKRLKFIPEQAYEKVDLLLEEVMKMMNSLIRKLKQ